MTLRGVNGLSFRIVTIELQDGCRLGTIVDLSPAVCGNVLQRTVQKDAFGMGIVLTFVVRRASNLSISRQPLQVTVDEYVTMIVFRIANPHKGSIAGNGAMIKERRTTPQDGVAATVDTAIQPVAAAIGLKGIAIADDMDILEEVAFTIYQQTLGLTLTISLDCQVTEREVAAIVGSKGGTTRREGATHLIGLDVCRVGVEHLIVPVVNHDPLTTLALDGDKTLVAEIH